MDLIDEPTNAMRSDIEDADIAALAASIEHVGLLQPITVRKVGERYEIIAGHRRYTAHKVLGRALITSVVIEADEKTSDAIKVHENLYRTDVNPVDQAIFLAEYMQRSTMTVPELAAQVNRSEAWVMSRLQILEYPRYLIEMVGEGKLSMATAAILNQIPNEIVREKYCRDAAIIGLSAQRAKYWLAQCSLNALTPGMINIEEPPEGAEEGVRSRLTFKCTFDGCEYPAEEMTMVYVSNENLKIFEEQLRMERENQRYDTEGGGSSPASEPEASEPEAEASAHAS